MRFKLLSLFSRLKSQNPSQTQSSKLSALSASSPHRLQESLNNSFLTEATEQLKIDEGFKDHAYQDHLGYWTIGYGRLIDKRRGGRIRPHEGQYLLQNDIDEKLSELRNRISWFDNLDDPRKGVLLNMCFQLGVAGLLNFKNTLAKVEAGDYEGAATNMLKSKWAKQTPNRAHRLAEQMRTGRWVFGDQ